MNGDAESGGSQADTPQGPWYKESPRKWFGRKRRAEAECLTEQIAKKLEPRAKDSEHSYRDIDCLLKYRFKEPLLKYGARGPLYGRTFTILSLVVAGAGFTSSAISANSSTAKDLQWLLILLGILVALITAINQLWKPGIRSVGSYRAGNSLRREGWDFVFDRGSYRSAKNLDEAFDVFLDKVMEIQTQVDTIDEVQVEVSSTTAAATGEKPTGEQPENQPGQPEAQAEGGDDPTPPDQPTS